MFLIQISCVQVTQLGNYNERYMALLYLRTGVSFSSFLICFKVVGDFKDGME